LTLVKQLEEVVEARREAEKWARIGLQARGLQILRSGLSRAEKTSEPWKEQLVDRWREALNDFECFRERPLAPGKARRGVVLRS
jgi:hypothetical protein